MPDKSPSAQPDWLALKTKISVKKAAALNDLDEETFRRNHGDLIQKVSPRRGAVELGDALNVGSAPKAKSA